MDNKKSVIKNYIYNLVYQVLTIILPLITTPYISRTLGANNIGIYSYTFSITTYFMLFGSLGISMYGQREIAYVQNDKKKRTKIFWEIEIIKLFTITISMIIFYFSFIRGSEYGIYYKILSLNLISTALEIIWFFQGLEEFKKTVTRNIIVKLLCLISIFLFVKNTGDLWKYVLIYSLSEILGNVTLWMYIPKYIDKVKIKELEFKRHLKPTIELFIPQISLQLYNLIDRTMIGNVYKDKSEVGYYEQAQKIIKLMIMIVTSLGTVLIPRMANMYANGEKEKIKEYLVKSLKFTYLLSIPGCFLIIIVANEFVPIFFGKGYEKVIFLLKISVPIVFLTGITNVIGSQYLIPTKKERNYTTSIVTGTIVNVILNYIFIPYGGAIVATITTIIGQFVILIIQVWHSKNIITFKELILFTKKYLIASLIMFFTALVIKKIYNNIYIIAIISALIYLSLLITMKDEIILLIKEKLYDKILKGKKND